MACQHSNPKCLNHYEIIRKYKCGDCGGVYICSCEREFALRFLPHQVRFGRPIETQGHIAVSGFADSMCAECRGLREEPHPKAAIYGVKGKIERFYWREIFKTYCELLSEHYGDEMPPEAVVNDTPNTVTRELRRKALAQWKHIHKTTPKYDTSEESEAAFLREIAVPTREVIGDYVQVEREGQRIGKWKAPDGSLVSPEELARLDAERHGYLVLRCERAIISCLVATFIGETIQSEADPKVSSTFRCSTIGWTPQNRGTPTIEILLPTDFGTADYWLRRGHLVQEELAALARSSSLKDEFVCRMPATESLRDYLWASKVEAIRRTITAIEHLPPDVVLKSIEWVMGDFWRRIPGWPDFLLLGNHGYRFSEVKSPLDELSNEQMQWFRWACGPGELSCELVRIRKRKRDVS